MLIKTATIDDLPTIAILFDQYRVFYGQDSDISLANDFLRERFELSESVVFYATNDNHEALGFVQLYPSFSSVSAQKIWVLNDLYVIESARKKGVATALLNRVQEYALSTHAKGVALQTATTNVMAKALYESLGYKKDCEFDQYFLSLNAVSHK